MFLHSDVWSEKMAAVRSLIWSQWLFQSSTSSTFHFQMHFIGTYSATVGHFSPTHTFEWYYLQQCHCGAETRSDAYITVVCNCNLQIFLIELVADTQYILPRHTLSVSSLFWTWIANRSNDIGSACRLQPRGCPLLTEGHFMCRLADVSQRASAALCAVHFLLPAPTPLLCCFSLGTLFSQGSVIRVILKCGMKGNLQSGLNWK